LIVFVFSKEMSQANRLSQPSYATEKYDEKLEELQKVINQMEQQYGFSEKHVELYKNKKQEQTAKQVKKTTEVASKTKPKVTTQASRYSQLPKVQVAEKEIPKPATKPEINLAYQNAHKVKPSLEPFYDIPTYLPKYVDDKDFQCKPIFCSDYGYFYNYMRSFGLNYTKQQ